MVKETMESRLVNKALKDSGSVMEKIQNSSSVSIKCSKKSVVEDVGKMRSSFNRFVGDANKRMGRFLSDRKIS